MMFEVEHGDVISVRGREHWLRAGWRCNENGRCLVTFWFTDDFVVVAVPGFEPALYLCRELALDPTSEPPPTLEVGVDRFTRVRRLPVELERVGEAPELTTPTALLAEYRGGVAETVWSLVCASWARAFRGAVVDARDYERWGGGRSTLE